MFSENEHIILVKDITVQYGDSVILENVSFEVKRSEIFFIVGGSGSGKSTLMRQMIGLETPDKGSVIIDGLNIFDISQKQRIELLQKIGVMFQSSGLFASMTIAENLELPLKAYTKLSDEEIKKMIEIKLDAVGLSGTESLLPSELSGGMRKRAGIARAMVLDPDILFFDEPCSGLDPVTAASIDKLIIELNAGLGTTMVIVTHDLQSIISVAHRIIMLDKNIKGIITEGTLEEIKQNFDNIEVYNFFNRIPEN